MTKQEYDIIVAQAKKENLTTSEHIRRKVLDKSKGKNQIVDYEANAEIQKLCQRNRG